MSVLDLNVYICGSGHSGTTLLDMLLGGHREISALGEVGALQFNICNEGEADRCACGQFIANCSFWRKIDEQLKQSEPAARFGLISLLLADPAVGIRRFENGQFHSRLPGEPRLRAGFARNLALALNSKIILDGACRISARSAMWKRIFEDRNRLYQATRDAHDTPIVVDSTKNPGFLKGIWWYRNVPMKIIEVIRDGRALCWARTVRENWKIDDAIRIWINEYRKRRMALRGIPRVDILTVKYEDLATDTVQELANICRFLNIPPQIQPMLNFRKARHNLGGNPMRYLDSREQIQRDERWRTMMKRSDRETFARKAGWLNERLGYR